MQSMRMMLVRPAVVVVHAGELLEVLLDPRVLLVPRRRPLDQQRLLVQRLQPAVDVLDAVVLGVAHDVVVRDPEVLLRQREKLCLGPAVCWFSPTIMHVENADSCPSTRKLPPVR
jgi:hypothetical protein